MNLPSIFDIAERMDQLYRDVETGVIEQGKGAVLSDIAGKQMKVYQMSLAYHHLRKERPNIPFLAAPGGVAKEPPVLIAPAPVVSENDAA